MSGGVCQSVAGGDQWCAYPDNSCSSGFAFSTYDIGDDLSGTCVPEPLHELTVSIAAENGGSGTVTVGTGSGAEVCLNGPCTYQLDAGTTVVLTSTVSAGAFVGWDGAGSGACGSAGQCAFAMNADYSVSATFGEYGQPIWQTSLDDATARSLAYSGDNTLVVAGAFSNTSPAPHVSPVGEEDTFVAKLDAATGALIWIQSFGTVSGGTTIPSSVSVGSDNGIYVAGVYHGPLIFGTTTLVASGQQSGYLIKFDTTGQFVWAKTVTSSTLASYSRVSVGGDVVAAIGATGFSNTFLQTFDINGGSGFDVTLSASGEVVGQSVFVDHADNVLVAGTANGGDISFGGATYATDGYDGFVAKFTSAGVPLWSSIVGASGSDSFSVVSVDTADNVFLAGTFSGDVTIDTATFNANDNNVVAMKLNSSGVYQWATPIGGTTAQPIAGGLAVLPSGHVVVAGTYCGTLDWAQASFSSQLACGMSISNVFVGSVDANTGTMETAISGGGNSSTTTDSEIGIVDTLDGRAYIAGNFAGASVFGGESISDSSELYVLALSSL